MKIIDEKHINSKKKSFKQRHLLFYKWKQEFKYFKSSCFHERITKIPIVERILTAISATFVASF
jgi:hypothetical protein